MLSLKVCSKCKTDKPESEFGKELGGKGGLRSQCKVCRNEIGAAYYQLNKTAIDAKRRVYDQAHKVEKAANGVKYRSINKDKIASRMKIYNAVNKESRLVYIAKYQAANKESIATRQSAYRKSNKGKINTHTAKRRASKLQATLKWGELNDLIISEAYELAQSRSELTSSKWHVDHIIPLVNDKVCGLHVGINLQVITAFENTSKGNKFSEKHYAQS